MQEMAVTGGFNKNNGNKTADHGDVLTKHGPGPEHRELAYAYYREYLQGLNADP